MTTQKKSSLKKPMLTVCQVGGTAGRSRVQAQHLKGLGLGRIGKVSTLEDTPSVRGMIAKVAHLVRVDDGPVASGN